jgi:hypothetical protein
VRELKNKEGPCRLKHKHLPWGQLPGGTFATAVESEYPMGMCRQLVTGIKLFLSKRGFVPVIHKQLQNAENLVGHKKRRMASTVQPRGKKIPELVSEFKTILKLPPDSVPSDWHRLFRHDVERGEPDDEGSVRYFLSCCWYISRPG